METVTIYALIVWLGSMPMMDPDDGHTAMTAGTPQFVGDYATLARCNLDREIYEQTAVAKCVPHVARRD